MKVSNHAAGLFFGIVDPDVRSMGRYFGRFESSFPNRFLFNQFMTL